MASGSSKRRCRGATGRTTSGCCAPHVARPSAWCPTARPRPLASRIVLRRSMGGDHRRHPVPVGKYPEFKREPQGLARLYGRLAFANAAIGNRSEAASVGAPDAPPRPARSGAPIWRCCVSFGSCRRIAGCGWPTDGRGTEWLGARPRLDRPRPDGDSSDRDGPSSWCSWAIRCGGCWVWAASSGRSSRSRCCCRCSVAKRMVAPKGMILWFGFVVWMLFYRQRSWTAPAERSASSTAERCTCRRRSSCSTCSTASRDVLPADEDHRHPRVEISGPTWSSAAARAPPPAGGVHEPDGSRCSRTRSSRTTSSKRWCIRDSRRSRTSSAIRRPVPQHRSSTRTTGAAIRVARAVRRPRVEQPDQEAVQDVPRGVAGAASIVPVPALVEPGPLVEPGGGVLLRGASAVTKGASAR